MAEVEDFFKYIKKDCEQLDALKVELLDYLETTTYSRSTQIEAMLNLCAAIVACADLDEQKMAKIFLIMIQQSKKLHMSAQSNDLIGQS